MMLWQERIDDLEARRGDDDILEIGIVNGQKIGYTSRGRAEKTREN